MVQGNLMLLFFILVRWGDWSDIHLKVICLCVFFIRWNVEFGVSRVPTHVLPAYRDQLASLRPDQVFFDISY